MNGNYGSGAGGASSGSNGPAGGYPERFEAEIWLLDQNTGIVGSDTSTWICLGVIRQIHPTKNVWLKKEL